MWEDRQHPEGGKLLLVFTSYLLSCWGVNVERIITHNFLKHSFTDKKLSQGAKEVAQWLRELVAL